MSRCQTEDHLIDPDATHQDSAQALLDEAATPAPVVVRRWLAAVERAELGATDAAGKLNLARLAANLRAELLSAFRSTK